jgi:hypothetical protein
MGGRLRAIIKANATAVSPKTWYGMRAFAEGGNVVCFFQSVQKFKMRDATLGLSQKGGLQKARLIISRTWLPALPAGHLSQQTARPRLGK